MKVQWSVGEVCAREFLGGSVLLWKKTQIAFYLLVYCKSLPSVCLCHMGFSITFCQGQLCKFLSIP